MIKTYILIEQSISGMGGGQMYIRNKIRFMEANGWKVYVFSAIRGEILIRDLIPHSNFIISELISSPMIYSKHTVARVINRILDFIGNTGRTVIESGSPDSAYWGELLAKEINATHICFLLDELKDSLIPDEYIPFFEFKLNRKELAGINEKTLKMLFKEKSIINDDNNFWLSAVCQNVVEDYDNQLLDEIPVSGTNIGCIGRLDKPYIMTVAKELFKFAESNPDLYFNFIFIGSSDSGVCRKKIQKLFTNLKNVHLILLGDIYPLPMELFRIVKIFISSAGSAGVSYRHGAITISIDANDLKAIGVLGYTTQQRLYRNDEPKQEICDLLEKILFKDYLKSFTYTPEKRLLTDEEVLNSHIHFMEHSEKNKIYYPVEFMNIAGKDILKSKIRIILGARGYLFFRPKYSKILKSLHKS